MTLKSDPPVVLTDPHNLIASGEPLAIPRDLAPMLGVSGMALKALLKGPLYPLVRFVRYAHGPSHYSIADARRAIEPHRAELEARRQRAADLAASERAAKAARIAASKEGADAPPPDPKPTPPNGSRPGATPPRARRGEPEIIVRRARP